MGASIPTFGASARTRMFESGHRFEKGPIKRSRPKRLPRADIVHPLIRCRCAFFLRGLVVQFDHDAVGAIDENLPEVAARDLPRVERHAPGLEPLFHAVETAADEGDVMHDTGIRLLRLVGRGDIDEMHDSLALAVHPGAWEGKIRPGTFLQTEHVLIEADRVPELPGPDVEMIEHTDTDGHARHSPFCE